MRGQLFNKKRDWSHSCGLTCEGVSVSFMGWPSNRNLICLIVRPCVDKQSNTKLCENKDQLHSASVWQITSYKNRPLIALQTTDVPLNWQFSSCEVKIWGIKETWRTAYFTKMTFVTRPVYYYLLFWLQVLCAHHTHIMLIRDCTYSNDDLGKHVFSLVTTSNFPWQTMRLILKQLLRQLTESIIKTVSIINCPIFFFFTETSNEKHHIGLWEAVMSIYQYFKDYTVK